MVMVRKEKRIPPKEHPQPIPLSLILNKEPEEEPTSSSPEEKPS